MSEEYQVQTVVIGAGVVGLAVARLWLGIALVLTLICF